MFITKKTKKFAVDLKENDVIVFAGTKCRVVSNEEHQFDEEQRYLVFIPVQNVTGHIHVFLPIDVPVTAFHQ